MRKRSIYTDIKYEYIIINEMNVYVDRGAICWH